MTDNNGMGGLSRFKAEQSGNPKGRPRKKKAEETGSAFDVLSDRRIQVQLQGVDRELTLQQALFYRTFQEALNGGRMALRTVLKKIVAREATRSPCRLRPPTIHVDFPDPANVDYALLLLGIATQPEGRTRDDGRPLLELEPWAVIAALARPKRPRLSDESLKEVKSQTRDPASIAWPSGGGDE